MRDAVHAVGEVVSSQIVAAAFADHGIASAWVDARTVLITDAEHNGAAPDMMETADRVSERVAPDRLRASGRPRRPIGATVGNHVDARPRRIRLLAAIFGSPRRGRNPDLTDVDGMLTADPASCRSPVWCRNCRLRSVGARVLRCEGAAPEHDSAGCREEHPCASSTRGVRAGHAYHGRRAADERRVDRAGCSET